MSDAPLSEGGYTLTETHCGGFYSSDCLSHWNILKRDKYLTECVRGLFQQRTLKEALWSKLGWIRCKINPHEGTEFTSQNSTDLEGFQKWCLPISQTINPSDSHLSKNPILRLNFSSFKGRFTLWHIYQTCTRAQRCIHCAVKNCASILMKRLQEFWFCKTTQ